MMMNLDLPDDKQIQPFLIKIIAIFLMLVTCGGALSPYCLASVPAIEKLINGQSDIVGIGLWVGGGTKEFELSPTNATNEELGYTSVLPSHSHGLGWAVGFSMKSFGVNIGWTEGTHKGVNQYADINQTPANSADDVFVKDIDYREITYTVLYQPLPFIYIGYGEATGHITFHQQSTSNIDETKRSNFNYEFYSLGLAFGFDPETSHLGYILTVFTRIPLEKTAYSGTVQAIGVGMYF